MTSPVTPADGSSPRSPVLDLIEAVARGDAEPGDVASALRNLGVDPVEAILIVVAQAARAARPVPPSLVDPTGFPAHGDTNTSKHVVPRVPFRLNGTLYDPPDVGRFEGRELHFIPARDRDELIVVDDRELMVQWWRLSFLTAAASEPKTVKAQPSTTAVTFPTLPFDSSELPGPTKGSVGGGSPTTHLWDDINQHGDMLTLAKGFGYRDLTRVSHGFLGLGDWNDEISSVFCGGTTCVLHEHVGFAGSTFTSEAVYNSLVEYGWNDRASSISTW